MGIIAILIGGVIGYLVGKNLIAKNWIIKLCYAVLCPVVIDILIVLMFTLTTGSSYAAGAYSVPFLLGSVGYLIMVLIEMKVK